MLKFLALIGAIFISVAACGGNGDFLLSPYETSKSGSTRIDTSSGSFTCSKLDFETLDKLRFTPNNSAEQIVLHRPCIGMFKRQNDLIAITYDKEPKLTSHLWSVVESKGALETKLLGKIDGLACNVQQSEKGIEFYGRDERSENPPKPNCHLLKNDNQILSKPCPHLDEGVCFI